MAVSRASELEVDQVAGADRGNAGQRDRRGRQLRVALRRAGRDPREEVPRICQANGQGRWASTPTTTSSWPSPTRSRRSSTGPTAWTPRWPGSGRGAGNCPMELLIGFLRNPKFHIRPIYQVLAGAPAAAEPASRMGPPRAVQHHRPAQPASPQRHGRPGQRPARQLRRLLRQAGHGRVMLLDRGAGSVAQFRPCSAHLLIRFPAPCLPPGCTGRRTCAWSQCRIPGRRGRGKSCSA